MFDNYVPAQEQIVSTIKIHINPYFKPHSLNQIHESSSSEINQQSEHNSSSSPSRSSSIDRQVTKSSNKKRRKRQNRKVRREKFIQQKELIFKNRSSLFSKSKQLRSSPDRWEHKEEKLARLYKQYSTEETFKHWKPLLLKDCFELYEYAFKKHYETA